MHSVMINREDWSGKQETMQILEDGSFKLMGYTFRLVRKPEQEDDYFAFVAEIHGEGWTDKLGSVIRCNDEKGYTALDSNMNRDDLDPTVAAAKLLCNLI